MGEMQRPCANLGMLLGTSVPVLAPLNLCASFGSSSPVCDFWELLNQRVQPLVKPKAPPSILPLLPLWQSKIPLPHPPSGSQV